MNILIKPNFAKGNEATNTEIQLLNKEETETYENYIIKLTKCFIQQTLMKGLFNISFTIHKISLLKSVECS